LQTKNAILKPKTLAMKYLKRNFIFGMLLLAYTGSYAQQEVVDTATFSRIRKAELSNSQKCCQENHL